MTSDWPGTTRGSGRPPPKGPSIERRRRAEGSRFGDRLVALRAGEYGDGRSSVAIIKLEGEAVSLRGFGRYVSASAVAFVRCVRSPNKPKKKWQVQLYRKPICIATIWPWASFML